MSQDRPPAARLHAGEAGFTLLELMLALAVLTFGLLGIFSMFNTALQSNQAAYHLHTATLLADDAMAYLTDRHYAVSIQAYQLQEDSTPDPTSSVSPLAEFPTNLDADAPGGLVNGLGDADVTHGRLMFHRTYDTELMAAPAPGFVGQRVQYKVRVTYRDIVTGRLRGVTLLSTRFNDVYDRL